MSKLIEQFEVQNEKGERATLYVYQDRYSVPTHGSAMAIFPGMTTLHLADGSWVSRIDDDTFQVVETKEILRRST